MYCRKANIRPYNVKRAQSTYMYDITVEQKGLAKTMNFIRLLSFDNGCV